MSASTNPVMKIRPEKYLLPKLQDILWIGVFLAVVGMGPKLLNVDGDLGRHLTLGGYILDSRSIPTRDLFSHTMFGQALIPHEWLAEVLYALAYRLLGLNGVVLLSALLISLTIQLVYRETYRRSQSILVGLALSILSAGAASMHWLARPHLFTLLLSILWVIALDKLMRAESQRWWVFPLMMLFWVNIHGAFIIGFVILLMAGLGWLWRNGFSYRHWGDQSKILLRLVWAGVASWIATWLNPSGVKIWSTSLGYIQNRYLTGHTAEYLSPDFHQAAAWPFLIFIVLSFFLFALSASRPLIPQFIYVAGWITMGLYSMRNIPIMAVVCAPILGEMLASEIRSIQSWKGLVNLDGRLKITENSLAGYVWPVVAFVLVGIALSRGMVLDYAQDGNRFSQKVFPVQAADWLATHPQSGNMFNDFTWGGYLLFRLWPGQRVFIDGQTDFYGEKLTRQYEQAIATPDGWREVFAQYNVDWAILPSQSPLAQTLAGEKSWKSIYNDETAVIYRYEPNP